MSNKESIQEYIYWSSVIYLVSCAFMATHNFWIIDVFGFDVELDKKIERLFSTSRVGIVGFFIFSSFILKVESQKKQSKSEEK